MAIFPLAPDQTIGQMGSPLVKTRNFHSNFITHSETLKSEYTISTSL